MSAPILIFGANGQLSRELQRAFAGAGPLIVAGSRDCDLANAEQTRQLIRHLAPRLILNSAAYTAVDKAESEPELALAINGTAPGVMAEEAARLGALFVHYSTDYVFDGSKPESWIESDPTGPLNVYGRTKLAGEQAVAAAGGQTLTFRTSWVYGPHGANFLFTMLRLAAQRDELSIVDDQTGAPTTSIELANATLAVIQRIKSGQAGLPGDWTGIYHMSCGGATTWRRFAEAIFARSAARLNGRSPRVIPIPSSAYPTPARRPLHSVLCNQKLAQRFQVRLAPWEAALDQVLALLNQP